MTWRVTLRAWMRRPCGTATVRSVGAAGKFTGSGGAVVAFCPSGATQMHDLYAACAAKARRTSHALTRPGLSH